MFSLMDVVRLHFGSDLFGVLHLISHAAEKSLVPPMRVGYSLDANCPQETDPMVLREHLPAADGHRSMVILHVIEQETRSGFVIVASVRLVEEWPVMRLPFDGTELRVAHGNLQSLAR
jgi:hypothetical protein